MKKEKIFEIGKKLGLSKTDTKAAILKNRNKIITGLIVGIAAIITNRIWFEPLHYIGGSILDFSFLTRFL
jgi:hypothetical protein